MGVPVIWDVVKPGFEERLPFIVLVTQFYKKHHRPIRIAIDAYQWVFECRGTVITEAVPQDMKIGRLLTNFHSRIRYLLSLNISFVLVFDGPHKPTFKRKDNQSMMSAFLEDKDFDKDREEALKEMKRSSQYLRDEPDVGELKKELHRWKIDYVDAPSEGESEAADLQRLGIVDYVLSNDTDTMIYGATKILRNFSKFQEDKPAGAMGQKATGEYWVTPIIMGNVTQMTGFDRKRLLFLSILCGADYNAGVQKLGPQRASQIALSSTIYIKAHGATVPYDSFPDFATELDLIYSNDSLNTDQRTERYLRLQRDIFDQISNNLVEYFGRKESALVKSGKLEGYPPDYIVKLYYKPLLCSEKFRFKEGSTNFAEIQDGERWMVLPDFEGSFMSFVRYPPPNVLNIGKWFSVNMSQAYLLKCVIHDIKRPITLEKTKMRNVDDWEVELVSVRYQTYFQFGNFESESESEKDRESPRKRRAPKGKLEWIPLDLIPRESKYYQEFYDREEDKKKEELEKQKKKTRSPRKNKMTQSSTLQSMGFGIPSLSPSKSPLKPRGKPSLSKDSSPQKNIIDLLKAPLRRSPEKLTTLTSLDNSPQSIIGSPFSSESLDSPEKLNVTHKIEQATNFSPIRVKSRKQVADGSPSRGIRTYDRSQLLNQEGDISLTRKRLNFGTEAKKSGLEDEDDPFNGSPIKIGRSVLEDLLKESSDSDSEGESSPMKPVRSASTLAAATSGATEFGAWPLAQDRQQAISMRLEPEISVTLGRPQSPAKTLNSIADDVVLIDSDSESYSSKLIQEQRGVVFSSPRPTVLPLKNFGTERNRNRFNLDVEDSSTPTIDKTKDFTVPSLSAKEIPVLDPMNQDKSPNKKRSDLVTVAKNKEKVDDAHPEMQSSKRLVHKSHLKEVAFSDDDGVYDDTDYLFESEYEKTLDSELNLSASEADEMIANILLLTKEPEAIPIPAKDEHRQGTRAPAIPRPALASEESKLSDYDAVMEALESSDDSMLTDDTIDNFIQSDKLSPKKQPIQPRKTNHIDILEKLINSSSDDDY